MIHAKELQCTICNDTTLKTMVDFGLQPPANRFISWQLSENTQETHPLALGFCLHCGTIQLTNRMPFDAIRPNFNWLKYNEPEGHLDHVSAELLQLPNIDNESSILGLTYKDQSTVDRLKTLGLSQGLCIPEQHFECSSNCFGLETIQYMLSSSDVVSKIKEKFGQSDIVLMRHVIEHTDNALKLIQNLKPLIKENGYLVIELPDSDQIFKSNNNHPFIWEEHISYFNEESLKSLAAAVGATIVWSNRYAYPYEDSLVAAFRFSSEKTPELLTKQPIVHTEALLKKFNNELISAKQKWQECLNVYRAQGKKIAVFGAGHLATKFINFFELETLIDAVIDDNPNKVGMKMPGSLLSIIPSKELMQKNIGVCISTLNPESEQKVRQKLTAYFNSGGVFIPAFSSSLTQRSL